MGNPRHRPKHLQHKGWFRMDVGGTPCVVRPVDGGAWFNQPGLSYGLVHLVDENSELVGVVEVGVFDKNAVRLSSADD